MAENEAEVKEVQPTEEPQLPAKKSEGGITFRKRSGIEKAANSFIKQDMGVIKTHVVKDVFMPTLRNMLYDIGRDVLSMILFGNTDGFRESRDRRPLFGSSNIDYRPYSSSYGRREKERERYRSPYEEGYDLEEDAMLETRGQAEEFKYELEAVLDNYKVISIADYKDILNDMFPDIHLRIRPSDKDYGWSTLARVNIERTRDGRWLVRMPKAMPID